MGLVASVFAIVGCKDRGTEADGSGGTADGGSSESGGSDSGGEQINCDADGPQLGTTPLRRLSSWEYDNTIRDLLGDDSRPSVTHGFPQEGVGGFDTIGGGSPVTFINANKYMLAAEAISERAVDDVETLIPCTSDENTCIHEFIGDFGRRAWRRPLTNAEQDGLEALYDGIRQDNAQRPAIESLIQAFLQSPNFLYRIEIGTPTDEPESYVLLSSDEMASRLSYFLWGSMPDDELFAAADADALGTTEEIAAQARRMLDDPKAREMVQHFHDQWLGIQRLDVIDKDPTAFPEWNATINALQQEQARAFVDHVVFESDGTLSELLTADYSFADPTLASFYGWDAPGGDSMQQVTPSHGQVSGVLSMGGVLSGYSGSAGTNPIARGLYVRGQFFCQHPPPPPPDVDTTLPDIDDDATTRERYEQHANDPACRGCHDLFDPIGFGFESYDGVGRFRTEENGLPIDSTGLLAQTDVDADFDGVTELGALMASSEEVAACTASQWWRFAHGRGESEGLDECNIQTLTAQFAESGYDIRELIVAMTQLDSFRYRTAIEGGE